MDTWTTCLLSFLPSIPPCLRPLLTPVGRGAAADCWDCPTPSAQVIFGPFAGDEHHQMYLKGSNANSNVNAFKMNVGVNKYSNSPNGKDANGKNNGGSGGNNNNGSANGTSVADKRFKTLPTSEMLPRNEVLGGYIFVCNNDTMQEDLKRQLFGLPARYRDSVRAITPGLPLFLYNYTTHQLHGVFEAASFGGSNIDPTAWEDKKCKGEDLH
uniref:DCD domain-containing protein n=1 Tax=Zea mays TaxID=4577 RepID=A0A804P604_MAIZE